MKLSQLRSLIKQEVRRTMNESRTRLPSYEDQVAGISDDYPYETLVEEAIGWYNQTHPELAAELKKIVKYDHADNALLAWNGDHPAFDYNDQIGSLKSTLKGCKLWVQNGTLMLRNEHGVDYRYDSARGSTGYGDWYPV